MPYDVYMNGPGSGWWIGGFLTMLVFWGAVVLLVVFAMRHFSHHHDAPTSTASQEPAAIETLKMRLARGEIDGDEFQRRVDLIRNTK